MPTNPRATAVPQSSMELVDHIPVREENQLHQQVPAHLPTTVMPAAEDKDLDRILTEVNQQVASTDMTKKKKSRFGFKKTGQPPATPMHHAQPAAVAKQTNIHIIDATAIGVAIVLIALAVKVY